MGRPKKQAVAWADVPAGDRQMVIEKVQAYADGHYYAGVEVAWRSAYAAAVRVLRAAARCEGHILPSRKATHLKRCAIDAGHAGECRVTKVRPRRLDSPLDRVKRELGEDEVRTARAEQKKSRRE